METQSSKDSRGRRKSSPSANEFYSRRIHNINDPDGTAEDDINKTARRLNRAVAAGNMARTIVLRERLVTKCMSFFYITGENVTAVDNALKHEGSFFQVDDIFIDTMMQVIDKYDSEKGLFTHMLRNKYSFKRADAAYAAAREDTILGGNDTSAPISLDSQARKNDDDTTTVGDTICDICEENRLDTSWAEEDERETVSAVDALEESGELESCRTYRQCEEPQGTCDSDILLRTISLISSFLGKSGRAANDTRKLYTRMFFSETVTRVTKLRTENDLSVLKRQERSLFATVELPFQDIYTATKCRTIEELWEVDFIEGVPSLSMPLNDDPSKSDIVPNYSWKLPGSVYVRYLQSIGKAASDVLVSQQRAHYEQLMTALTS